MAATSATMPEMPGNLPGIVRCLLAALPLPFRGGNRQGNLDVDAMDSMVPETKRHRRCGPCLGYSRRLRDVLRDSSGTHDKRTGARDSDRWRAPA